MKVIVADHQGKARFFAHALSRAGLHLAPSGDWDIDGLFVDVPAAWGHYYPGSSKWELAQEADAHGVPVFGIPHGAGPVADWDGAVPAWEGLTAELVHGKGLRGLLEFLDYPVPIVEIGWSFSAVKQFRSPRSVDSVVFAPTHPGGNGVLFDSFREANSRAYKQFLGFPCRDRTVRMFGTMEQNGLWPDDRVKEWVRSDLSIESSVRDVDSADLVIGDGTFLHLAVARGVPAVSIGQPAGVNERNVPFPRWDEYKDLFRYPYALDEMSLDVAAAGACRPSRELAAWRDDWVGGPLRVERVLSALRVAV